MIQANLNTSLPPTYKEIKKNTLAIRIFYDDLSYTLMTEAPKAVEIDIFAKIGGLLGK